jgi:hypothetical protein
VPNNTDSSIIGEFTLYSKNDVTAAKLRWLKFNLERRYGRQIEGGIWLFTVQYYYYW